MDLKENLYLSISAQCWCLNRVGAEEADRSKWKWPCLASSFVTLQRVIILSSYLCCALLSLKMMGTGWWNGAVFPAWVNRLKTPCALFTVGVFHFTDLVIRGGNFISQFPETFIPWLTVEIILLSLWIVQFCWANSSETPRSSAFRLLSGKYTFALKERSRSV